MTLNTEERGWVEGVASIEIVCACPLKLQVLLMKNVMPSITSRHFAYLKQLVCMQTV